MTQEHLTKSNIEGLCRNLLQLDLRDAACIVADQWAEIERLRSFAKMILAGTTKDGLYNGRSPDELWTEIVCEPTPVEPEGEHRMQVRYVRVGATNGQAERFQKSDLFNIGDAVLVWVNEGDLYQPVDNGNALGVDMTPVSR